jgi:hypothetical protein
MGKRNGHGPRPYSISKPDKYRLVIRWPGRQPLHFSTSDRARARRIARHHASGGAHVDFQTHQNWDVYTTTHTYTPETQA